MNNKRNFLLFLLLGTTFLLRAQTDISESKFYVKVYGGYGLITPGSYKLASSSNAGGAGNTSLSKTGLGAGIRAGGGIGVIISDFLNIGADVEYLSGASLKSNTVYSSSASYYISRTQIKYTSLSITPHVVFKALSKPDYLIYNRFGILLNLPMNLKKTEFDSSFTAGSPNYYYSANKTGTYKVGLTAGLSVALGVQVRLTDNLRGFAELFGNYLVLSPTNYDENSIVINNGAKTSSDLHGTYIKDGQTSYNSPPGSTTTTYTTSVNGNTFNMNAVGVNIGITYRF